jgi:hypothetical protein
MKPAKSSMTVLKQTVEPIPACWDRLELHSVLKFCGAAPRYPLLHAAPAQPYLPGFAPSAMRQQP